MTDQPQQPPAPKRIWPPDPQPTPPAAPGGKPKDDRFWSDDEQPKTLRDKVIHAAKKVFDPEIPVNIYDLGLVYKIDINEQTGRVVVLMTLTTPHCPEAETLPGMVRSEIERIPEVKSADVNITWEPPWDKKMMSEEAKLILGME